MKPRDVRTRYRVCEYASVVKRASDEGWLASLVWAHLTPCSRGQALAHMREAGALVDVFFRSQRGRAHAPRGSRTDYAISLPPEPGVGFGRLRVGLVLHEAAHVIDRRASGTFGHKAKFCAVLHSLVDHAWRMRMATDPIDLSPLYARHAGPFSLMFLKQIGAKQVPDSVPGPLSAADANREAIALIAAGTAIDVYVYSDREGQYTGAIYSRGNTYVAFDGQAVAPQPVPEEPSGNPEGDVVVPAAVATVAPPKARRATRRGVQVRVVPGSEERWPKSAPAQVVLACLTELKLGSVAEILTRVGEELSSRHGVQHPASLIARLKQAGLVEEGSDE